jgi:hypothetical protein
LTSPVSATIDYATAPVPLFAEHLCWFPGSENWGIASIPVKRTLPFKIPFLELAEILTGQPFLSSER